MTALSDSGLSDILRARLGVLGDDTSLMLAFAADCVRAHLAGTDEPQTIHALTNRLREMMQPAFGSQLLEPRWQKDGRGNSWAVRVVKALETLGDVYRRPDGRYQPTLPRLIRTRVSSEWILLTGGLPYKDMCDVWGVAIASYGYGRFARLSELSMPNLQDAARWQDFMSWLGEANVDSGVWCDAMYREFAEMAVDGEPIGCGNIEVFFPEKSTRRWQPIEGIKEAPSGVRLCRGSFAEMPFRPRHLLAILDQTDTGVSVGKSMLLEHNDGLRMVFAFARKLAHQISVTIVQRATSFSVRGLPKLPLPERRIAALAITEEDEAGRPVLYFPLASKSYLIALLIILGVRMYQATLDGDV